MDQKIIDTFNCFVNKTDKNYDCWNWIGPRNKYGGPIFRIKIISNLKEYSARRVSLQIEGKILSSNEQVFYICDNKLCVNSTHLITGNSARFWAKVQKLNDEKDCWIWIGAEDKNGYGKFCYYDNNLYHDMRAHRYSWEEKYGPISSSIILVCHKCDNPPMC